MRRQRPWLRRHDRPRYRCPPSTTASASSPCVARRGRRRRGSRLRIRNRSRSTRCKPLWSLHSSCSTLSRRRGGRRRVCRAHSANNRPWNHCSPLATRLPRPLAHARARGRASSGGHSGDRSCGCVGNRVIVAGNIHLADNDRGFHLPLAARPAPPVRFVRARGGGRGCIAVAFVSSSWRRGRWCAVKELIKLSGPPLVFLVRRLGPAPTAPTVPPLPNLPGFPRCRRWRRGWRAIHGLIEFPHR